MFSGKSFFNRVIHRFFFAHYKLSTGQQRAPIPQRPIERPTEDNLWRKCVFPLLIRRRITHHSHLIYTPDSAIQNTLMPQADLLPPASFNARIVTIAVPCPLYKTFDYLLPDDKTPDIIEPGMRVRVDFGRQKLIGIIIKQVSSSNVPSHKLKPVISVLDKSSLLSPDILELLLWAARYYVCPLGEVIQTALPVYLRNHDDSSPALNSVWSIKTDVTAPEDALQLLTRAPKQLQIYQLLHQASMLNGSAPSPACGTSSSSATDTENGSALTGLNAEALNQLTDNWRAPLKVLIEKRLVTRQAQPAVLQAQSIATADQVLNEEQQTVVDNMSAQINTHAVHLLNGITGSGKTEVYLALCRQVLDMGKQILVLVPEIGLTPQLTERFLQRLNTKITVLHSAMNDTQRYAAWHAAANEQAQLVIGTRSSIFTPLPNPGLIIIDEEHDGSYKQQDGFRYNARDLAILRAKNNNIPILLGSATPSLESLNNSNEQRYIPHYLKLRANKRALPEIKLINTCSQKLIEGVADSVLTKIKQHLSQQGQVLIFINRRGFAPLLMCHECGWTTQCNSCDANMTYHKRQHRLYCHHCGAQRKAPDNCEECGDSDIIAIGAGTERIEQFLQEHFKDYTVSRVDRDTTRNKGSLQEKLSAAHSGESNILVGTQMLAKGHDFPNMTLVCILDTDQALFSADFRAAEHLAQLITQVSGRAGRANKPGEVLIQTHHPDHPLLQTLLHSGYQAFSELAMNERRVAGLPPVHHLALLRCESVAPTASQTFLEQAIALLDNVATDGLSIYGPLTAPMERRAGRYRFQVMLQSEQRKELIQWLNWWAPQIQQLPSARKTRWSIDVDPYDTF